MTINTKGTPGSVPSTEQDEVSHPISNLNNSTPPQDLALVLSLQHYVMLKNSAISDDVIRERGYRTIYNASDLAGYNIPAAQRCAPCLLLPLHTTDGQIAFHVLRPDSPRMLEDRKGNRKIIKYETPKGESIRLDCSPRCRAQLGDPSVPLWITEGQKKADALASAGQCAIALLGVWNYITKKIDKKGRVKFDVDWECIEVKGRIVYIVFDSDVMTKPQVREALDHLTEKLQRKGAQVSPITLLPMIGKGKMGVDDWLAAGRTIKEIEELKDSLPVQAKAPPDDFTLLDEAPPVIARPLALIKGQAYAAAWLYGQRLMRHRKDSKGNVTLLATPELKGERNRFIVRSDGMIFGDDGLNARGVLPLSQLGFDLALPDAPITQVDKLWSKHGVSKYCEGARPDPCDVFSRMVDVIDSFVDFETSIADQKTMCEIIACYCLSTWMIESSSVAGYLWAWGESGCGKTQLLLTICELSHLGTSVTSNLSSATARDLCELGAVIGFDDAEKLSDPKKTDPDVQALLLSSNRRGASVPLKEQSSDGKWTTRLVNAFSPKIFSAISQPFETLSNRAIVVPLTRTDDRKRANSDPLEARQWAHDRRTLIDDLWALALAHLAEIVNYDSQVGERSKLIARDLQPFRGLLSIAAWLDDRGVNGLWERMESFASTRYQNERGDLERANHTKVLATALIELAAQEPDNEEWRFTTQTITEKINALIETGELDMSEQKKESVGRKIKKMRLESDKSARPRAWKLTLARVNRLAKAYQVTLPESLKKRNDEKLTIYTPHPDHLDHLAKVDHLEGEKLPDDPDIPDDPDTGRLSNHRILQKKCSYCGHTDFWQRADGELVCESCHPNPVKTSE